VHHRMVVGDEDTRASNLLRHEGASVGMTVLSRGTRVTIPPFGGFGCVRLSSSSVQPRQSAAVLRAM
jgi:hypothetical protein